MTDQSPSPSPRRRGGQLGNSNALKFGLYTRAFKKAELSCLENSDTQGLADEINLLRVTLLRLTEHGDEVTSLNEYIELVRALSQACTALTRLVRVQHYLSASPDPFAELRQALAEYHAELSLGDSAPPEPDPSAS